MTKDTKYRFRFFQNINKRDSKKAIALKKEREKTRTEKFVKLFQSKNENELREILDNRKGYQDEAVKAAEIVLKNKSSSKK